MQSEALSPFVAARRSITKIVNRLFNPENDPKKCVQELNGVLDALREVLEEGGGGGSAQQMFLSEIEDIQQSVRSTVFNRATQVGVLVEQTAMEIGKFRTESQREEFASFQESFEKLLSARIPKKPSVKTAMARLMVFDAIYAALQVKDGVDLTSDERKTRVKRGIRQSVDQQLATRGDLSAYGVPRLSLTLAEGEPLANLLLQSYGDPETSNEEALKSPSGDAEDKTGVQELPTEQITEREKEAVMVSRTNPDATRNSKHLLGRPILSFQQIQEIDGSYVSTQSVSSEGLPRIPTSSTPSSSSSSSKFEDQGFEATRPSVDTFGHGTTSGLQPSARFNRPKSSLSLGSSMTSSNDP